MVLYILRTIYYASLCFLGRKDVRSEKHRNLIWFVSHDDRWKFMTQIWKKDQTSISPKCSQTFQNIAVTQLHKLRHSVSMQTKRHQKDKKKQRHLKNVFDNHVIPLCLSKGGCIFRPTHILYITLLTYLHVVFQLLFSCCRSVKL